MRKKNKDVTVPIMVVNTLLNVFWPTGIISNNRLKLPNVGLVTRIELSL